MHDHVERVSGLQQSLQEKTKEISTLRAELSQLKDLQQHVQAQLESQKLARSTSLNLEQQVFII